MAATVLNGAVTAVAYAAPAKMSKPGYTPATRTLRPGMNGRDVRRLQERLAQLAYYPGARDGRYGADTEEAVWAFEEVQNMPASGTVTVKVERALVNPRYPTPAGAQGRGAARRGQPGPPRAVRVPQQQDRADQPHLVGWRLLLLRQRLLVRDDAHR